MSFFKRIFHRPFFIRLFHWEYWSFAAIYTLIYPVWFFLCLRARSFFFFSASNPSIKNGGFLNESKKEIAPLIPQAYLPKTLFVSLPANVGIVIKQLAENGLSYPLIGKPDIGGRGRGIKALKDETDLANYVSTACLDFHIQEYVAYKNEVGIFYCRMPGEEKGRLTGIVRKEFMSIVGDGRSTVYQLLQKQTRALLYLEAFEEMHKEEWNTILEEGVKKIISPYGNHARGALFLDDSHLIDEELVNSIDAICKQIPDFYYGRMDIRFDNWEDLRKGKKLAIIEVNGAGSEPTHIYDPRHSLFFAWKEIIRHWVLLWKISRLNNRKGIPYMSFREGIAMFKEDTHWSQKLEAMPL